MYEGSIENNIGFIFSFSKTIMRSMYIYALTNFFKDKDIHKNGTLL